MFEEKQKSKTKLRESCTICGALIDSKQSASLTNWIFRERNCKCSSSAKGEHHKSQTSTQRRALEETFEILGDLGSGGMGEVLKVRHKNLDKIFALKRLKKELVEDPVTLERFKAEVKALEGLSHPHIVAVFEYGEDETGRPYFLMEYVDGITLDQVLQTDGVITSERLLDLLPQLLDALEYAHQSGIIHRDLKPGNIILQKTADGHDFLKILDFGIAKIIPPPGKDTMSLTKTGEIFGTPEYMSPEQCQGVRLDARSDIYSLGCLLYRCLVGRPPFVSSNSVKIILGHIYENPLPIRQAAPSLLLPEDMQKIISACLEKEPDSRYQKISELRRDIDLTKENRAPKLPDLTRATSRKRSVRLTFLKSLPLTLGILAIGLVVLFFMDFPAMYTLFGLDAERVKSQNLFMVSKEDFKKFQKNDAHNLPLGLVIQGRYALERAELDTARSKAIRAQQLFSKREDVKGELDAYLLQLQIAIAQKDQDGIERVSQSMLSKYGELRNAPPSKGFRVMGWWYFPSRDAEDSLLDAAGMLRKYNGDEKAANYYRQLRDVLKPGPLGDCQRAEAGLLNCTISGKNAIQANAITVDVAKQWRFSDQFGGSREYRELQEKFPVSEKSEASKVLAHLRSPTLFENFQNAFNGITNGTIEVICNLITIIFGLVAAYCIFSIYQILFRKKSRSEDKN